MKQYERVIGLEVHVELATETKIFCSCSTEFGGKPNTHICPICTGMPGTLPVLNKEVVEHAIAVGLATNSSISKCSNFDRKNYFYPDNPQNYQVSQLYFPICRNGGLEITTERGKKWIGIHEIHMEEDAGKLIHEETSTLIDYNRSGVPLIEIVTEPDMESAEEVNAFLDKLRMIIQYLGASDCKLNEGSMRVDVNLSVREIGSKEYGTRTEMKNLNSFKAIKKAIENETKRQIDLLTQGGEVIQETRRWDDDEGVSYSMRSKEGARDYRYFPEPDLPPLVISDEWIEDIKKRQPEFPDEKRLRYQTQYGLPEYDINLITSSKHLAIIFEETIVLCHNPKEVSNWLMVETMRLLKEHMLETEEISFSPANLAKLINMIEENVINRTIARDVFEEIFKRDIDPEAYVKEKGLTTIVDTGAILEVIEKIIKENSQSIEDIRQGKVKAKGYLMGQVMKAMGGKGDPAVVREILEEALGKI